MTRAVLLELLRRLTATSASWAVWKNVDAAVFGTGDVDAVAVPADWPLLAKKHRRWALGAGAEAIFECRHIPGVLLLVAVPSEGDRLNQVDISSHLVVRGAPLVAAHELRPALLDDPRGFRRLRPGAEGLIRLAQLAGRDGAVDRAVLELLASDREGEMQAAKLMGRAGESALRAAEALLAGDRRRSDELWLRALCLLAAGRRPVLPARRVMAGLRAFDHCPLIEALQAGRRVPEPRDAWIERVARLHRREPE